MKKSPSILSHWLGYLIRRDKVSKLILLTAIAVAGIWFLALKDNVSIFIPAAGIVGAIVFSFLSYVCVGLPRIGAEKKLYDSIDSDCKLPSKYNGRNMSRINVEWKFLVAQKVTVQAEIASSAVTSTNTWRAIRSSVSDAFSRGRQNYITVFDEHERGTLIFIRAGSSGNAVADERLGKIEDLTAFVYDSLHKYGNSLPRIRDLTMGVEGNEDIPHSFKVSLPYQADRYSKQTFERDYNQKYENSDVIWVFKWSGLGVEVSHIVRGTDEERKQYVIKSIADLLASSYNRAFHYGDKDYVFSEEMVEWDANGNPERLIIDFLHTDVSNMESQEQFQQLVTQGLHQIFKTPYWDFTWCISSYEKLLTILKIDLNPDYLRTEDTKDFSNKPIETTVVQSVVSIESVLPEIRKTVTPFAGIPKPPSRPSMTRPIIKP